MSQFLHGRLGEAKQADEEASESIHLANLIPGGDVETLIGERRFMVEARGEVTGTLADGEVRMKVRLTDPNGDSVMDASVICTSKDGKVKVGKVSCDAEAFRDWLAAEIEKNFGEIVARK